MPGYDPKHRIEDVALAAERILPDNAAFLIIVADVGAGGKMSYVSNIKREDAIKLLKEFLFAAGEEADWMKQIT